MALTLRCPHGSPCDVLVGDRDARGRCRAAGLLRLNVERRVALWKTSEVTAESGKVPLGDASALVRIPRFGKSYVMPVLGGTSNAVLAQGFGHFAGTAQPGQEGNYALAAHRVTHGEPMRRMPELRPGDEIVVETRHATYTYVLDTDPNDLLVPFTAGSSAGRRSTRVAGSVPLARG